MQKMTEKEIGLAPDCCCYHCTTGEVVDAHPENEIVLRLLIAEADKRQAEYPQYKGQYDNFQLVAITGEMNCRSGSIPAGTITIGRAEDRVERPHRAIGVEIVHFTNFDGKPVVWDCITTDVENIAWLT